MDYEIADGMSGLVIDRFETETEARDFAVKKAAETGCHFQLWSPVRLIDVIG